MQKKKVPHLILNRETLRCLDEPDLRKIAAAGAPPSTQAVWCCQNVS